MRGAGLVFEVWRTLPKNDVHRWTGMSAVAMNYALCAQPQNQVKHGMACEMACGPGA